MKTNAVFVVDGTVVGSIKVDDGIVSMNYTTTRDALWEALGEIVSAVHNPSLTKPFNPPVEESPT